MTRPRAFRLLGPAALGSALVGAALLVRSDSPADLRQWDEADSATLPAVARAAVEARQSAPPQLSVLRLDPVAAAPAEPQRPARTRLATAASDIALATRLADQARAFEPPTLLLPPDLIAPDLVARDLVALAAPAPVLPAPSAAPAPTQWAPADPAPMSQALPAPSAAEMAFIAPLAPAINSPVPLRPALDLPPEVAAQTGFVTTPPPAPQAALAAPPPVAPLIVTPAAAAPAPVALAASAAQGIDFSPGRQVFPGDAQASEFSLDDELILQLRIEGQTASDTIVAYGTRGGVYLPLGELARILDLAIQVGDDGHFASGWFLDESRVLELDLRRGRLTTAQGTVPLPPGMAQAFDGELYLRSDVYAALLPLDVVPDLRAQSVLLSTREPFPFEERMRREQQRDQLASRGEARADESWPREETPWLAASVPIADVELRAVSDSGKGLRAETDLRLAGDLAFMTAQAFFTATSRDGLITSLVELGRRDADGDLLGPLGATQFQVGDVATPSMTLGLRGASGRGGFITNQPLEQASVFDRVDLRGVLPDGYEVELYRNDVLLGSTALATNGQYEFLEVPVDYGLNIFRLVFYGPQGQRREEVRRISVGDGRLSAGEFHYSLGAVQRGVNLLGVEGPDFRPGQRHGDWQGSGDIAFGISPALTAVASAAIYQDGPDQRWIASTGLRTGLGGLAVRGDAGFSDGGGGAFGLGLGGRALGGAFALSHFEYGGGFADEVHSLDAAALARASEFDFNTSLLLGSEAGGTYVPISTRVRHAEYADGRTRTSAGLRGSARLAGLMVSNTLDYLRNSGPGGIGFSQLVGNFDLATFDRSDTQLRGSLGYRLLPDPELVQVSANAVHRLDDDTVLSGTASYSLEAKDLALGLSGVRQFDRFSAALDGQYSFRQQSYSVAFRLGFSLGRDPLRQRFFVEQPGMASSGAVAMRAFHDRDGDGRYSDGDLALPDVEFAVFNNTAATDAAGMARLGELGHGNRVSVQLDPASLPDIAMAPATRGVEIVPRAGRFHVSEFAVVELSEVEGTVSFASNTTSSRGVSGLRLQLRNAAGEVAASVRTERDGYFFFEQVSPGTYAVVIEPEQAARLGLCLAATEPLVVGARGDVLGHDLAVSTCTPPGESS